MLPPGRARLGTNARPTGSPTVVMMIGIVLVACSAARVGVSPAVTIQSTLRRTSSAASPGRRSGFPSADRYSMAMFLPSMKPSSRSPWRKASSRDDKEECAAVERKPIRGSFSCHCASANELAVSRIVVSSQVRIVLVICCCSYFLLTTADCLLSLDHLIRSRQHVRRNRQADLLGCFEIDDELELRRLLDWQVSRLSTL